ncbi:MAG: hypothetical protein J6C37_07745 [Roseburia sp.]|nr:hypothetical protein [Roseburia sp.]
MNKYLMELAKEQIKIAFEQAEKVFGYLNLRLFNSIILVFDKVLKKNTSNEEEMKNDFME